MKCQPCFIHVITYMLLGNNAAFCAVIPTLSAVVSESCDIFGGI
jgi:hypothetical protein